MIVGRLFGWLLLALALLFASGDAVMALGLGEDESGIATGHVVALLSGYAAPEQVAPGPWLHTAAQLLLHTPAWTVLALLGLALCRLCRPRPKRHRFRPA